jgi:hypothetical protein
MIDGKKLMLKFDEVDIKKTLLDLDIKLRPKALVFYPSKMRDLAELVPDLENRVELLPTMAVPEDIWYLVDREEIEKWKPVPLTYKGEFENV